MAKPMAAPLSVPSPRSVIDSVGLMFTFDGEFGEELTIGLTAPSAEGKPRRSSREHFQNSKLEPLEVPSPTTSWSGCHNFSPINVLLGSSQLASNGGTLDLNHNQHAEAKAAQLLMQWLALPATDTLVKMIFSQARRGMSISRDLLEDHLRGGSEEHRAKHRAALPVAPSAHRGRWSVSGGTPRRPPMATPEAGGTGATPRKRRNSEPNLPVLAFDTPLPAGGRPPTTPRSIDDSGCNTSSTATPRKSKHSLSPSSEARALTGGHLGSAENVHSPLAYFGTQPDVSSRFLTVPHGDGGTQDFFDSEAGGPGLTLTPEALLKMCNERLDLPKAVARLVVKRAQERQKAADEALKANPGASDKENDLANNFSLPPPALASGNATPGGAGNSSPAGNQGGGEGGSAGAEGAVAAARTPWHGSDEERPIGFAAFFATYGVHRPEEADKIRIFRLIKRGKANVLTPADVTELVWAVSETHAGLEFLRDSEEFLKAYVQTTALRILWSLSGVGPQRITLQHWRHSSLTEVLFQLDEEADINLARDYFSYNHFYVIWCIFWELDEDEDSLLQKDDLLRYGSYGLSARVVDRIWTLRRESDKAGMTYNDFVCFLLAEEDKQTNPALQYWFHVLDYDSDGYIDARDMWWFYEELQSRLEAMNEEIVAFSELANELFDIVRPAIRGRVSLAELRKSQLGFNFVSALTNVRKYIAWEGLSCEKAAGRASNLRDTKDWDLFADSEYRRLVESEDEGGGEAAAAAEGEEEDAGTPVQSM